MSNTSRGPFHAVLGYYTKTPLIARILIAFVLGTIFGLVGSYMPDESKLQVTAIVQPFGTVLISLLKMVVIPVVFFSLLLGAASLPLKKSGKLGITVLVWYFLTSVFATIFGVALAKVANPRMVNFSETAAKFKDQVDAFQSNSAQAESIGSFFVGLFKNPFEALAGGHFLPIVVFSILAGLAIHAVITSEKTPDEDKKGVSNALSVCRGCQAISFKVIDWVMEYFPIGVFALAYTNFATSGVDLFGPYLRIIACVMAGTLGMIFVVYPLAVFLFCHENPYKVLSKLRLPIVTAFTTRSSAATLSVSLSTSKELGISQSLSSFSLPLGCTINMDGVCVHLPVFVVLASNIFGVPMTPSGLLILVASVVLASVGAGGVPGGSVFLLFMILENAGFTPAQVAATVGLALGVNPILDMFETACNVTGDNICTYIIAKRNDMLETSESKQG